MTARVARAFELLGHGRFDLAEKELRAGMEEEPPGGLEHSLLGLCLARLGKLDEARVHAARGIELDPDEAFSHYVMSLVHLEGSRIAEAETSIRSAIALSPDDASYRGVLAKTWLARGRWPEALEAAEDGLKLDPEHEICTDVKGIALTKLGRGAEATHEIESALQRAPENSTAHANKGWLLLHGGKGHEGIVHFREALRLDPTDEYARAGLVEALKARSRLYGWLLAGFLWLTRFSHKSQIFIIIGAFIAYRVLRSLAKSYPAVAPLVIPIVLLYNLIWLSSWFGRPFFNLLLRFDREGRLALSPFQTQESNVFALLVGGVLASVALLIFGFPIALFAALYFGGLLFPAMSYYDCSEGWTRTLMAWLSVGLGVLGVVAFALAFLGYGVLFMPLGIAFLLGVLASLLFGPFLSLVTPKR